MNIVIFTHPDFLVSQSMPRFAGMLIKGMEERGHKVEVWAPTPRFYNFCPVSKLRKWFGYIDQYVIFPAEIHERLQKCSPDTLFVFTDHALGPWVPLVKDWPHIIHCHDFLAQYSAQGKIKENRISLTGRRYQQYIRKGYSNGKNFISVSNKTRDDLHSFLSVRPQLSEVVYNGLNKPFTPGNMAEARAAFGAKTGYDLSGGYLLHVGGNQWYKNRIGVIEIYNAWRSLAKEKLPLLLIGKYPVADLLYAYSQSPYQKDIYILSDINDESMNLAYTGATVFLYPSLAEGFGWPIAEAMACGTPVVTTNEAPMTEVAGNAAFLIGRRPDRPEAAAIWAIEAAKVVDVVVGLSANERQAVAEAGIINSKRFDTKSSLDKIEDIYHRALYS